MKNKLAVIVPVYNAAKYLSRLATTLEASYPTRQTNLRFVFTDDASPDKSVADVFRKHSFFQRADVSVVRHKKNKGYTGNVNSAIERTARDEDVVLLNSDTEVASGLFERLQQVALENPLAGSITPLTNHGTIASVFNWPHGGDWNSPLSVEEVNRALPKPRSGRGVVQIPTPIGFCVYLPKRALASVGPFNEELFPRGYGEENDWGLRASQIGFVHYLALDIFVLHASGKSFEETKAELLRGALEKIDRLYPSYHSTIARFLQVNPWERERWDIMLSVSRAHRAKSQRKLMAVVLHNDPEYFGGGVEVTVKNLTMNRLENGYDVMQIFPQREHLKIRYVSLRGFHWEFILQRDKHEIEYFAEALADVDVLNVHHLLDLWPELLMLLTQSQIPEKVLTLHDYWAICPSVKLIGSESEYCRVPSDMKSCNACLQRMHPDEDRNIQRYRMTTLRLLLGYNRVEVPSEEAKKILLDGFASTFKSRELLDVQVKPNFVPRFGAAPVKRDFKKRVIFLGAFSEEKGGNLINEILPELYSLGYEAEIWGLPGVVKHSPLTVTFYRNVDELYKLKERAAGSIVCVPSIWPETFSYTFYEAVSILKTPVVVGPFGHPASVTKKARLGEVMKAANAKSLKKAILDCANNFESHQQAIGKFQ